MLKQTRVIRSLSMSILLGILALNACKPGPIIPTSQPAETAFPTEIISTPSEEIQPSPSPTVFDGGLEVVDDGSPLPPRLVEQTPQGGEELPVDGEIILVFDQSMDGNKTAGALQVTESGGAKVAGKVTWSDKRTLHFKALEPLQPGTLYFASLSNQAADEDGITLEEPVNFQFQTAGELLVSQVFPADGSKDVASNAVITVIFNRPVAPLVISEERSDLPQPLVISPSISGKGEWVNTSVYAFRPERAFQGGVTYTVVVKAGLKDSTGASTLSEDYTWQFSTTMPGIESFTLSNGQVNPENNFHYLLLDDYFSFKFLQSMDQTSTEAALSLTESNGEKVLLTTEWKENFTTLVITPTKRLSIDIDYELNLSSTAESAVGTALSESWSWKFTTVPPPAITSIYPSNGSTQTYFDSQLLIQFASPMKLDTVEDRIVVTPEPKEEYQWWYSDYSWNISAYFLEPSTKYEVRILPGMEDIYGNQMKEELVYHFTTAALQPSGSLLMPYDTSIIRAEGPSSVQEFYADYVNAKSVSFALYSLTANEYMSFLNGDSYTYSFVPSKSTLVWRTEEKNQEKLNQRVTKSHQLSTAEGNPLPPGFYFLTMDSPEIQAENYVDQRLVIVANANLTFKTSSTDGLVWLTDLESGKPIPDAQVTIYDNKIVEIGNGITDKSGLLLTDLPTPDDPYSVRFALVNDGENFAFASGNWGSGVSLWDYGIWSSYYAPANQPTAYIYTERPIYRPGQPVFFKGIVRQDNDLDYSLPDLSQVKVKISNYKETVFESDLSLSNFGSFDGELSLDNEAILGYYTLEAYLPGKDQSIGSVTFNVAEYRKPEFQVKVSAKPENVLAGENFTAEAQADYYSGGGVADAEVSWTLTSEPFYFTPPEELSSYNFTDIEEDVYQPEEYQETGSETVAEGSGSTDLNGHFEVGLQADLSKSKTSRTFTFEATLTDISKNAVSGRAQLVAHRSMVYPGVKPGTYVGIAGDEETFDLVALDWEGNPLPGQKLSVEIVERKWYSVQEQDASGRVQWTSTVEEIPVSSFDDLVVDDKGKATVSFTPPNGGVYRAKVTARDEKGNLGRASAYMWVAGKDYIPWRQTNDRSFNLVADKKNYTPGDTAEILIASPFQGEAYALVTVERGRIRHQEVILLTSNSTVYRLQVTSDLAPNAYLSVLVVKGVDDQNPRPNYKMGIVELKVNTKQQTLQVEIIPDRSTVSPGEQVTYDVRTHDYQGKPVSAEVSMGLSDLATLSLMPPNSQPILEYFFSRRILGVWTSMPIGMSIDEYNANIKEHLPQGAAMGAGGGKGEGDLGVVEVRQDFPDTAFWDAYVVTNQEGEATVAVTLPDNLTTWRMDARAVTSDTLVGQSTEDIVSTKPLLIRPQTPRFFVENDQVRLGAAVQNNTQQALTVNVNLDAQGLTLQNPKDQKIEVGAGKQSYLSWDATVDPGATRVDLVFSVEGGEYRDASRPPQGTLDNQGIPVYRYEAHETVGTSGQLTTSGTKLEAIYLPRTMQAGEGELTIKASPSLAAGMTDGLTYLKHFPYECVEQTISRFLPNVLTTRALNAAGITNQALEDELKIQVSTALQRLYNWQNADGGWGWWKGDESDSLTSAYVLMGLIEAKNAGYSVSDEVIQNGLNYLRTQVLNIAGLTDPQKVNRQAFILYVLARAGQPDVSSTVQLYEQHQRMAIYSRAFLASTLFSIDNADPRLDTLLSDITNAAIVSATGTHWEEKLVDRWNWSTDTRTTAIVLSTVSLLDPKNPLNANAVRWLMSNRTAGHWRGTQETAWTLMALTNWMVESGELQADFKYAVALNGKRLGGGVATAETLRDSLELKVKLVDLLKDEVNRLAFAHDEGPGNLYYTAHLDVSLPVEQTKALDQGIVVSRSYYQLDDLNTPVNEAKQGDLLLARITIVAPGALHYLVVDDPLPSGFEAVNQSLVTSPQSVEVPQVYSWEDIFWRGWGWWFFRNIQLRDEKAVLSTNYLPAGTYVYTYLVRASTIGEFRTIPTVAQEFYFPEVYGRGEGSLFTITP